MDFEAQLIEAARKKLLREIEREAAGGQSVVNNIGLPVSLREQMAGGVTPEGSPEDDYYVGIRRTENDKGGWDKMVRRFKTARGEKPPKMSELFAE